MSSAVTRSTSRSARSRPRPSPSTARRICSTTTSRPSPTTTSRSRSCGLLASLSATRAWCVAPLLTCLLLLTTPGIRCCPRPRSAGGPGQPRAPGAVPEGDERCRSNAPSRRGGPGSLNSCHPFHWHCLLVQPLPRCRLAPRMNHDTTRATWSAGRVDGWIY